MFLRGDILVPTDFSHHAAFALSYALAMAKKSGCPLHFLHVIDVASVTSSKGQMAAAAESDSVIAPMREHAEGRLRHLVSVAEDDGITAQFHIVTGRAAPEIIALADQLGCGLIVIATHGRTGFDHLVFGSVCEKVVRHSKAPVLSIKHPEHEFVDAIDRSIHLERIVFPTDFSAFCADAAPVVRDLCREFGASLTILHVAEPPMPIPEVMPETAASLADDMVAAARNALEEYRASFEGVDLSFEVASGSPYREICRITQAQNADLVIMPTHGHSSLAHRLFGGVTERVLRLAPCPVLSLRAGHD